MKIKKITKITKKINAYDLEIKDNNNYFANNILIHNCCIKPNIGVFARSHSTPTDCKTFDYIKNIHYYSKLHILNENYWYFGENVFAIHSIKYTELKDSFYLFGILDIKNNVWLSFDEIKIEAKRCEFNVVPILFEGKVNSINEIKEFCDNNIDIPSYLGGNKEGFVVRIKKEFKDNKFSENISKYVRKNHVQSDKHWKVNWKPQEILK